MHQIIFPITLIYTSLIINKFSKPIPHSIFFLSWIFPCFIFLDNAFVFIVSISWSWIWAFIWLFLYGWVIFSIIWSSFRRFFFLIHVLCLWIFFFIFYLRVNYSFIYIYLIGWLNWKGLGRGNFSSRQINSKFDSIVPNMLNVFYLFFQNWILRLTHILYKSNISACFDKFIVALYQYWLKIVRL